MNGNQKRDFEHPAIYNEFYTDGDVNDAMKSCYD